MKKTAILFGALMALTSCGTKPQNATDDVASTKSLVIYYSQTGATKQMAETLQQQTGADLTQLSVVTPYDGDFNATIERCQKEMAEGIAPEIVALDKDVAAYDTIYLCYPVWFGTYAQPVAGLIKSVDLKGKVIVPCCTFGSGGLNTSTEALKAALPESEFIAGYGVRNARIAAAPAEVKEFLTRSGIIEGEVETLPEYGEQQPVTPELEAIFNAACGSYPMPLGAPISAASRTTSKGADYCFITENKAAEGQTSTIKVYIIVPEGEGATPEFTQVER